MLHGPATCSVRLFLPPTASTDGSVLPASPLAAPFLRAHFPRQRADVGPIEPRSETSTHSSAGIFGQAHRWHSPGGTAAQAEPGAALLVSTLPLIQKPALIIGTTNERGAKLQFTGCLEDDYPTLAQRRNQV